MVEVLEVLASKEVRTKEAAGQETPMQWMWIEEGPGEEKIRDVLTVEYLDIWLEIAEIQRVSEEGLKRSQKRTEISKPSAGLPK